jgi:hypothetical protein
MSGRLTPAIAWAYPKTEETLAVNSLASGPHLPLN